MAGQAEFWKQRINMEKRGEDFTQYWATTQPKMFSPSSLHYIDGKAHSHMDHAVLQQQAEVFKQVKSPNKYMRLNHNLDRMQVGLVQSPVSSPSNRQMQPQAPRTQPLPYRQLEFQTPTQRPRRMVPMSQSHNQLDLIMPSTSKPTSAFEYSQQLKKKKEFARSYMSSPSPVNRLPSLPQHPQITTATQLRPSPPARCEKPSAFYETMLRNKVYL